MLSLSSLMLSMVIVILLSVVTTSTASTSISIRSSALFPNTEMQVLHALHGSTNGEDWAWREDEALYGLPWNFTTDGSGLIFLDNPCSTENNTWQGIVCSAAPEVCLTEVCNVVRVDLTEYNLMGSLPDNWQMLSELLELTLWLNSLTGTIPNSLSQMQELSIINLEDNQLVGTFPVFLCNVTTLTVLKVSRNLLTGPLSPEVSQLVNLEWLALYENLFTGPIISEISQLTRMQRLYLFDNHLTGPLLPEFSQLSMLGIYAAHRNLLTGPIIPEVTMHPFLIVLSLQENLFTGSLPAEINQLVYLNHLYVFENHLSGTIPSSLGDMMFLRRFSISQNMVHGSIPSEMGNMISLRYLYLYQNALDGSLPESLGNLVNMQLFSAYDNQLTGPLIEGFANMTSLNRMLLQNNKLSGSLNNEAVFAADMTVLEIIDLSNNKLSGSIPRSIFRLPRVTTIALSLNCFRGDLPLDLCGARDLQVLSMDGLGGATGCRHEFVIPVTGVRLFNTLDGSVPPCLWQLRNLTLLHLASNGLTGSIMQQDGEAHGSSITHLSLAHNHLTGTIPAHIRDMNCTYLDLSYNKFNGKHIYTPAASVSSTDTETVLRLEVNRLSGPIPSETDIPFSQLGELKLLRDNLFSCNNIPSEDEDSQDYSCGSQNLNLSIYLFLAFTGVLLLWVVLSIFLSYWFPKRGNGVAEEKEGYLRRFYRFSSQQIGYLTLFNEHSMQSVRSIELAKIYNIQYALRVTALLMGFLLVVVTTVGSPIYVIKLSEYGHAGDSHSHSSSLHSTHSYQYLWVISMAFITGELPAALIITAWLIVIGGCYGLFVQWEQVLTGWVWFRGLLKKCTTSTTTSTTSSTLNPGGAGDRSSSSSGSSSGGEAGLGGGAELIARHRQLSRESQRHAASDPESRLGYATLFLMNLLLTASVNIAYVYSVYKSLSASTHVLCQVALALAMTLHNTTILPLLTTRWIKSGRSKIRIRLILSILNSVLIPAIATMFTSPSCFQNLLVDPDETTSTYYYQYCSLFEFSSDGVATECQQVTTVPVDVLPMTPPFSYNNMCFSVLLTTYIPVYIFVYSFQAISPFILVPLFSHMKFLSVPRALRKPGLVGLCWSSFWRKEYVAAGVRGFKHGSSQFASHGGAIRPQEEDIATARMLFDDKKFCLKIAQHLTILLTFGICSPVLAIIVVLSLVLQLYMHVFLIGRFVEQRLGTRDLSNLSTVNDHALKVLSTIHIDIRGLFGHLFGPLVCGSALFFAFLSWDVVVDVTGSWQGALWAPGICIGVPLLFWAVAAGWSHSRGDSANRSRLGSGGSGGSFTSSPSASPSASPYDGGLHKKTLLGAEQIRSNDLAPHDSL